MAAKRKSRKPLARKAMKKAKGGLNYGKIQITYLEQDHKLSPATREGISYTGLE